MLFKGVYFVMKILYKHKQKYKYDFEVPLLTYTSLLDIASLSKIEVRIPRYIQVKI